MSSSYAEQYLHCVHNPALGRSSHTGRKVGECAPSLYHLPSDVKLLKEEKRKAEWKMTSCARSSRRLRRVVQRRPGSSQIPGSTFVKKVKRMKEGRRRGRAREKEKETERGSQIIFNLLFILSFLPTPRPQGADIENNVSEIESHHAKKDPSILDWCSRRARCFITLCIRQTSQDRLPCVPVFQDRLLY